MSDLPSGGVAHFSVNSKEAILVATPFHLHLVETSDSTTPPRSRRERPPVARPAVMQTRHRWYRPLKKIFDFTAALGLAVFALPVIAVAILIVKLTSRGPAFYTQTRLGLNGQPFTIWKIRTMIDKCESLTGPRWSMPGDPRVTRFGWLLRVTHLDELPQLWNVLRGDMSLIGPRPERPEFLPELEQALPTYRWRLAVRPGVTGLAQVQLPSDTDIGSVRRKLAYDLYYIENLSPWMDLRLLFGTVFYAVGLPFQTLGRMLGLPDLETVQRLMHAALPENTPAPARRSA
jgi:lipopolysaccharide/colanic/teichoic acid biosynthesis glycosyltransferase